MFGVSPRIIFALIISYLDRGLLGIILLLNALFYLRKNLHRELRPFLLFYLVLTISTLITITSDYYALVYDIVRYLLPLLGFFFGRTLFKSLDLDKALVSLAKIIALLHIAWIIVVLRGKISLVYNDEVEFVVKGFIEVLSIQILMKDRGSIKWILFLSLSVFLYASRSTLLLLAIVFIMQGRGYFRKYYVPLSMSFVLSLLLLVPVILENNSKFSLKLSKGISELTYQEGGDRTVTSNWRGYEAYRAVKSVCCSPKTYLFGLGLGSKIDLGFSMALGNNEFRYVSKIHNVYAELYAKGGLIGVLFMLRALYYYYNYYRVNSTTKIASIMLIVTGLFVGGLFNLGELFFIQLVMPKMRKI